jgi:WD40 repeat protein/serine/threonine protein kinase
MTFHDSPNENRWFQMDEDSSKDVIWKPGIIIADLYEVKARVGCGAMGIVHRVHHLNWDIDLAVKTPNEKVLKQVGGAERFQEREAYEWVRLGLHPNIVSCFYVSILEDGVPHLFVEYVGGGRLTEWLAQGKIDTLPTALDIGIQLCWGLGWAHKRGVLHLDVNPNNVLMTSEGTPKVTDFGLTRPIRGVSESADNEALLNSMPIGGTVGYAAPEQLTTDTKLTAAIDVYALGIVLYELLQRSLGLPDCSQADPKARPFIYHREIAKQGNSIAQVLWCSLSFEPDKRYQDALQLAEALIECYETVVGEAYTRKTPDEIQIRASGLNNMALSLMELGKKLEAEAVWEQALQVETVPVEATYNHGLVLWRSGRITDDAFEGQMQDVCAAHPGEWLPKYLLGQVYLEKGDWRTAVRTLEEIEGQDATREEVVSALKNARERLASPRPLSRTFVEHTGWVTSVCMSADGRFALSASYDGWIKLWEVNSGECLGIFKGHRGWVLSACLSTDGLVALSGSSDATLKLWDIASGECLRTFEGHGSGEYGSGVNSVCLTADGRYALSGGDDHTLKLWDVASGECLHTFKGHRLGVSSVCLSADDRYALSGSYDGTLKLWSISTVLNPSVTSVECLHTFRGHKDGVRSVCLSTDGHFAVSGAGSLGFDFSLKLWDVANGECLRTFEGHRSYVLSVSLTADGRHVISGSNDTTLKLWDVDSGQCLRTLDGHEGGVRSVCFSTDEHHILSGSNDGTLKLWEVDWDRLSYSAPVMHSRVQASELVLSAQTVHDEAMVQARGALRRGDVVAAAKGIRFARLQPGFERAADSLQAWNQLYVRLARKSLRAGWESMTLKGHPRMFDVDAICLSFDGQYVLTGSVDRTVRLWDVANGECLRTFEGHEHPVNFVRFSPDGRFAWSGSTDGCLRRWKVASGECIQTCQIGSSGTMCLSTDERYAIAAQDLKLALWEVVTGRCLRAFQGHRGMGISSVCFSPDGRHALSGGSDCTIKLWNLSSGAHLTLRDDDLGYVYSVCFSADGRYAMSASGGLNQPKLLKLWSLNGGSCLRTLRGHQDMVHSVWMSTDGRYAVSGSSDRTVKLWDLSRGKCLRTFEGHTKSVYSVCMSTDGRHILSGGKDQMLRVWALDWELEDNQLADWDEGAQPYLENFLSCHTPYSSMLPPNRQPTEVEVSQALTRQGRPTWRDEDLEGLLYTLGCAGYGWLRPKSVRRKLEESAASWDDPPELYPLVTSKGGVS